MIRGYLDSIILRFVLEKDRYGYEILKEISLRTDQRFQIKEATLYAVFQEKKEYYVIIVETADYFSEKKELQTNYECTKWLFLL